MPAALCLGPCILYPVPFARNSPVENSDQASVDGICRRNVMGELLGDCEVYLVYIDSDRCDYCEQYLIMCPTDVFEMPHKAIPAGRRTAVSIDKYLSGDGKLEVGSRNAEFGSEDTQIGIN
jgi:ferredoxin